MSIDVGDLYNRMQNLQITVCREERDNHRNHIKKGVSSCELTEHFLHNPRTHNFDNDAITTITEQIKQRGTWLSNAKRKSFAQENFFGKELLKLCNQMD